MQHLPHDAELRPYNAVAASKRRRLLDNTAICVTCFKPLSASSYVVTIPRKQIDGIWYSSDRTRCCSQECALHWLKGVTRSLEPSSRGLGESCTPITDTLPTEETRDEWIYAFCENSSYPKHTERSGKWQIFFSAKNIDTYWLGIKHAIEQGQLGSQAKVSTRINRKTSQRGQYVICVYTYDYEDSADARRIREALRDMGFMQKLPYKSNEDTLNGFYGSGNSKYFE